jgi:hypothetical protein
MAPEPVVPKDPVPPRLARVYAVGVQCIATSLGFFLTAVVKLPVPLYFPLLRRWSTTPNSEELAMDFYGRSLVAIGVGFLAAALTLVVFQVRDRLRVAAPPAKPAGLTLLTVYAATALALGVGVFAYQLYGRPPMPEPLPPGLSTLQTAKKPTTLPARSAPATGARPPSVVGDDD